jgi:hypothetical protein
LIEHKSTARRFQIFISSFFFYSSRAGNEELKKGAKRKFHFFHFSLSASRRKNFYSFLPLTKRLTNLYISYPYQHDYHHSQCKNCLKHSRHSRRPFFINMKLRLEPSFLDTKNLQNSFYFLRKGRAMKKKKSMKKMMKKFFFLTPLTTFYLLIIVKNDGKSDGKRFLMNFNRIYHQ